MSASKKPTRLSEFVRVKTAPRGEFIIESRAAKGKNFGTEGSVQLYADELQDLLDYIDSQKGTSATLSEFTRVKTTARGGVTLESRGGRGERFGSEGSVLLEPNEISALSDYANGR